jgi:hypothetical protein
MNITIKVEAEELIAAINKLAAAVSLNPAVIDQPVVVKNAPAKKPAKAEAPEATPAPEAKAITLEQVRAKLAEVSNAGKKNEVKELLTSYGVSKLTDLPAEKYSELLAEAEAL